LPSAASQRRIASRRSSLSSSPVVAIAAEYRTKPQKAARVAGDQ
jgi:hypothetical protein